MSQDDFTAVISFSNNQLSLYGAEFQFKATDTILFVDEMVDNGDEIELRGQLVPMVEVFDFGTDYEEYYTREQFEKLGIRRKFEEFESEVVEKLFVKKQFPWFEKKTVEMCHVPNGHYGAPENQRKKVSILIPKVKFTIFDFCEDTEDK